MHTNRSLISALAKCVLFCLVFIFNLVSPLNAQESEKPVAKWLEAHRPFAHFKPFTALKATGYAPDVQQVVDNARTFELTPNTLENLYQEAPQALLFTIPDAGGSSLELELIRVEILAPDFQLNTDQQQNIPYQPMVHYRGIVRGQANSVAALSVSATEMTGMVADESGTFELGKMTDGSERYIFYRSQDLKIPAHQCASDEESLTGDDGGETPGADDRGVGCKTVQVYFECDYKLYNDKGASTTNVSNYVTALFNQVATLYANANVGVAISQIYVWTTPDPYTAYASTSSVLNAFRQTRGTTFNGNLAHFLTTRSLGGGIAYVDVICFKQYAYGVSAISTTYQNVPTYSWSVEVVTHELGHNMGSWHTHSCNWPGGALDNCVSPEGSCSPGPAPVNGGTIMSYCHLTNHGINFNNGFGTAPGQRIRDKVLNAACLQQSGVVPTGLNTSNITSTSATVNWSAVPGATSYTVQYKLSTAANWTTAGNTSTPSYNLTGLTAGSIYNWQVKTDCSNYSASASFSTMAAGGGGNSICSVPAGLVASSVGATTATLMWGASQGASTYTLRYKVSSAGNWTTAGTTAATSLTLNNLTAATNYVWQVKANCSDWSPSASFTTSNAGGGGGTCNVPANLTNNTIGSTYAVISWGAVSGATNYVLQIKLANGNDWFSLGAVTVTSIVLSGLSPATSYHWRVKANCSDYSAAKLLTTNGSIGSGGTGNLSQPTILENVPVGAMELFPNPVSDRLQLRFTGDLSDNAQLRVCDAAGRIVAEQAWAPELELGTLSPGIYFVILMDGERRLATERVVKLN